MICGGDDDDDDAVGNVDSDDTDDGGNDADRALALRSSTWPLYSDVKALTTTTTRCQQECLGSCN